MPPAADRSPSTLSSPLSGRRIISRLASPFTSKSRAIADFYIDIDDPHKQYSPGDVVTGSVRLRVTKPTRVTHIVVSLHGFVQVYKNPGSPGDGFRANAGYVGAGRGKKTGEYFGNGFASLFEDEVVLCGDGRLADGSYQFNFELQFPDTDLPSSIDFERGTISYMVTTTMTRPTTMSPTMTCDRKIYVVERIDISPIYPPKPRTITLETLLKRTRARHQARRLVETSERRVRREECTQQSESDAASMAPSAQTDADTPISPAPSELSFDSVGSSNGPMSQADSARPSPRESQGSSTATGRSSATGKSITATVESLSGGCLRGDNVCIKVNVNHTKPIRSLYGVIVTLYRQARVDLHPAIPLGPTEKGSEGKHEDYYPKSVTGLGGLSLSGAGSSHLFRKDLAQVMVPLYVDPASLTAEVNAKVRVPDEAFPTISTVPGSMISFKYFAEVVVDIQGKLGNQDRNVGGLSLGMPRPSVGAPDGGDTAAPSPYGSSIIDTVPIRRDKGVITSTFELVVGTQDSARRKGKRKVVEVPDADQAHAGAESDDTPRPDASQHDSHWNRDAITQQPLELYNETHAYDQPPEDRYPPNFAQYQYGYEPYPPPVPLPQMPVDSEMSEKERIRQAETRLLPSQPPGTAEEFAGARAEDATAPHIEDEPGTGGRARLDAPFVALHGSSRQFSVPPRTLPEPVATEAGPSAPAYGHVPAAAVHTDPLTRETQPDLGVRRSAPETPSAPAIIPEDESLNDGSPTEVSEPSAPPLGEEVGGRGASPAVVFDSHADATAGSGELPRYER
ncbi:ph-response sensor protein [Friedmanniomyces endolithicus]|uniref:Ph-response sensor protein n=1 Tax=Friedmanniomyces endolithicus TaxID=329885 RepID=A0AAN6FMV4_9PEZI|nr:ph-response sensor protein [Friedmanniomyces endolithicus]KAK0297141.1 ph-response sensor protein [Friedmanniomyces endolithicus]KAK0320652.1 ph-response sensor protein [Friedmanniomyces endolithicus]KAK1012732.1 ph-response sensor protein [Friedmanniomyces endolithicus]